MGNAVQEDNLVNVSVLVVDDSAFMRNTIGKIVESADGLSLAGTAMNGRFALQKIPKLQPDIIVLDLEMPEMSGIEFLQERKKRAITIPVVILSSIAHRGAKITMDALSLGAADFLLKPSSSGIIDLSTVTDQLVQTLKAYGNHYALSRGISGDIGKKPTANRTAGPTPASIGVTAGIDLVVIGISTGGPNALRKVFRDLREDLPASILVVQHMPAGFTAEFAASLDRICSLRVKEAEEGDIIGTGRVFIAPGDYHLEVKRERLADTIHINQAGPVNGHRPSVDVLFRSVAGAYKGRVMAIIMTGMGKDGANAIGEIQKIGGLTIGQDEESSVVYGMPRAAYENGFLTSVVPLDQMAETINSITG